MSTREQPPNPQIKALVFPDEAQFDRAVDILEGSRHPLFATGYKLGSQNENPAIVLSGELYERVKPRLIEDAVTYTAFTVVKREAPSKPRW